MIKKQHDYYVMFCDGCGKYYDGYMTMYSVKTLVETAKVDGWSVKRVGTGWRHLCTDCLKVEKRSAI